MRFSQIILTVLPIAGTCLSLALPTTPWGSNAEAAALPESDKLIPRAATSVQVGFGQALNWDFVSSHPQSAAQITSLLPKGVAYGLNIAESNIGGVSLTFLDTSASLGYKTTLARFTIPSEQVQLFNTGIKTASSRFYSNPDSTVKSLMNQINPAISTTS